VTVVSETRFPLTFRSLVPLASVSVSAGLAAALSLPFMALFLTSQVGAGPFELGAFLLISPLAGLATSAVLGRVSDARAVRRNLLVIGSTSGAIGSVLFAILRNYWVLLAVSVTLMAIASSLLAQMFAYARQFAEHIGSTRAPFVISVLRMLISLAWVAGPSVAAVLVSETGYAGLYLASALFFGVVAVLTGRLPELGRAPARLADVAQGRTQPRIVLAAMAFVMLQGSVALAVNAVPLFVTTNLGGTEGDAGLILGLCAALEIPLILLFGMLAEKTSLQGVVLAGASVAIAYHSVMLATTSIWQVAAAQVLHAIVISAVMGVGISYFQALAPDRPGFTTTLFTNTLTVGAMLSGPMLGLAQQLGYRTAYVMSLAMSTVGVVLLVLTGMITRRESVG
jgi:MFS transporter, SET family, sugar efflux transporter